MKKIILIIALALFSYNANAQFSLGAGLGLPTGDAESISSLSISVNANYMFESESDFKIGVSVAYLSYLGKTIDLAGLGEVKIDNVSWLPLAAVLSYNLSDKFSIGSDIGYGVGLSPDGIAGGFYLKPSLGYSLGEKTSLNLNYTTLSNDGSFSNIGLGIALQL